jgi:lysozyme
VVPVLYSTAAGRYQLLGRYWNIYKIQLNLPDYSPASQDAVALQQIKERKAIDLIEAGQIEEAITACSNIWASFPGNTYGQGGHSLDALVAKYASLLNPT